MIKDLILDLGAHIGDDTEFYLAKGFRVVAIDAHPGFACRLRHRFADELRSGQLQVINVAIAECAGFVELLESQVDSQWSTIDPGTARTKPGDFRALTVPAIPFDRVLAQFGVPYFLKIDVEGSEKHVINELKSCKSLPVHISFEVNAEWVGQPRYWCS